MIGQIHIKLFFVGPISTSMKLMMYLGNDLIESIPINTADLRIPGYLGKFKRSLKIKYQELVVQSGAHPEFLVFNPEIKPELPSEKRA